LLLRREKSGRQPICNYTLDLHCFILKVWTVYKKYANNWFCIEQMTFSNLHMHIPYLSEASQQI
jgi:hypothetical protein